MAKQIPVRGLVKVHRDLLRGYRAALRDSEALDAMSGAFVRHVIAVSADEARGRLVMFVDGSKARALADELGEFAAEVRKRNHVGRATTSTALPKRQRARSCSTLKRLRSD